MKKATKLLITAAAVAAVAGVAGVSYAAWEGSTDTSVSISNGVTGQIATVGAITVTPDSASGSVSEGVYTMNPLCPVDQTTVPTGCVKYWKFTLSTAATGGQSVKYQIKGGLTKGTDATNKGTDLGSAKLKYLTGDTAPSAASEGTALDASTACTAFADTTVYIFLTADNTEAMNASISVTFEAVAG